jgi:thiol-disulfide isomerase/thioredoxin
MGKATRIKQQNAREKIAAQRAAARRAEVRNRVLIAGGSVVAVLAIVLALVLVKAFNKPGTGGSGTQSVSGTALSASAAKDVTSVPASTLNTVGTGSVLSYNPQAITPISGSPPLTSGGKPEMLYIGAEFCPYCAAERWAMAIALSRFGTLSPLHGIHSAPSPETDPNTPTLTFYQSSYTSPYLVFTPIENETVTHATLQTPTSAQMALWAKYDSSSTGGLGYPFIDFGNKFVIKAPSYDPGVLAGMTWAQVAAALHNPNSAVAKGADGAANMITAAICKMTNGQPGSVCAAPGVVTASKSI